MNVDKRVVEMQFNNQQFEKGVKDTVSSLNDLKKGLDLSGSAKSLADLQTQSNKFNLANISDGVQTLVDRFSTLGIIGMSVLANLTSKLVDFGLQLTKSLTVDSVLDGLGEYETKINAITTILTNTQTKGTTLDQVNASLADLNEYADKTIYNFADMTKNIGTFTAAGVGLERSVTSIKGIANLAAGSGSSAAQASTAMYQLSQAIASGSVKLMDWNSVVNAGMGGELFQNALKETAKEMGVFVDTSIPFRESLKDGWLSSEILTKTLSKFAEDESLLKAATQVKTFTQLMSTMKESVGSGWAVSWEHIIGDREEAAALFTGISDGFDNIVGSSTDARNAMLEFWNTNGGRSAVIDSLSNAFNGLMSILKPIGEAWRNVFPAMTGERLVELSNKLKDLTSKFKIGEETAGKIKTTFQGFFSLLNIGKTIIGSFLSVLGKIISSFLPAGEGVLDFTANIGEMLIKLDKAVTETGIFKTVFDNLGEIISSVAKKISSAIKWIVDAFDSLTNGLDFNWLDLLAKSVSVIGSAFRKMGELIRNSLKGLDFNSGMALINGGILAGILLGVKKFIGNLTDMTKGGGFLDSLKGILDGVKGSLESWQQSIRANTILKIAGAIALLAGSLILLASIDPDRMASALAGITTLFVELFASMAIFSKIMSGDGYTGMTKVTTAMLGLSTAVLILSFAMKNIASLSWEEIAKGLTAIGALMLELVGVSYLLNKSKSQMVKGSVGLILFSTALVILAQALKSMGSMQWDEIARGLGALTGSLAVIAVTMKAMPKNMTAQAFALIAISTSLIILSKALKSMGSMSWEEIGKGLGTLAGSMSIIAVTLKAMPKDITAQAFALLVLSAALTVMAKAIQSMGSMSWDEIAKGLGTMGGAISILAVTMKAMPKNMGGQAASLLVISASLAILATVLGKLGGMTWDEIAKGLGTLAGSLSILAVTLKAMTGALSGAAAVLVVSAALAILAPILVIFGNMSWDGIGKGLIMLAGVFGIFGVAGLVLGPIVPVLYALAGAIALLGIGTLAAGAGILAFGIGLTALAAALAASGGAIYSFVESLISLIPMIIIKIGEGLIALGDVIIGSIGKIKDVFVALIKALVSAIRETVPDIVDGIFYLIDTVLDGLVKYVPVFVDKIFIMLIKIIDVLAERLPELIAAGGRLFTAFITGVLEELAKINGGDLAGVILALGSLITIFGLIATLGGVVALAGISITAMAGVLAILGGISQIPGLMWLINEGGKFMGAIGKAIGSFIGGIVGGIALEVTNALPQIGTNLSNFMINARPFFDGLQGVDPAVLSGIGALAGVIVALTASNVIEGLTSWFSGETSLESFGKELAAFGPYFRQFYDSVQGIDGGVVQASANAALALAEMASKLPNQGGVVGWYAGENGLSAFAKELAEFGPILKSYADSVTGLDAGVVENSVNAAKALSEMASNLPNQGGVVGWFAGENSLSVFANELKRFGPALKSYADSVTGLDAGVVEVSANAAKALAQMADNLPNQGGMVSWFTGDNTLSVFGTELEKFGPHLKAYADSVTGLDAGVVTSSTSAAKSLAALANNLPNQGGMVSWFTGDNNISTFGENLESFGKTFKKYYDSVSGINAAQLNGVITGLKGLVSVANGTKNLNMEGFKNFGESLKKLGNVGIDAFIKAFEDCQNRAAQAGILLADSGIKGVNSTVPGFKTAGQNAGQGFVDGLDSKLGASTAAGKRLGKAALTAAEKAIDSNSPSKEFMYLGEFAGEGFALGIDNSSQQAMDSSMAMAQQIIQASQKEIKDFEDWVNDRKYYNELNLIEELRAWEAVQARYAEGTEERKKADREVYRIQNEIVDESYQNSIEWIEEEKYYKRLSLEDELAAWERVQARYMEGSEERKKADREVYRLRNDLGKESFDHSMNWIEEEKYYNRLSLEEELAAYERIQARYEWGSEEWIRMEREKYRIKNDLTKADFQNSMDWIEERKYYNDLTLADELAAWKRVQARYAEGTEERKKADREIYRLEQEQTKMTEDYANERTRIEEDAAQKRMELQQEYYDVTQQINDKLAQDIKQLDDQYKNSLESRTNALYSMHGLFDKVDPQEVVSGDQLIQNLQDQEAEFNAWQSNLDSLSAKGVNKALIDELRAMGVSSAAQVAALNGMTEGQLQDFVRLWSNKHKAAADTAKDELEDMRIETQNQIRNLELEAKKELEEYQKMWEAKMNDLNKQTSKQLGDLEKEFSKNFTTIHANTHAQTTNIVDDVVETVDAEDWKEVGGNVVEGMSEGITEESPGFVSALLGVITSGLDAVKQALGIASPSKEFAKLGRFMDEGLVLGLSSYSNLVADASKDVGDEAVSSINKAISSIGASVLGSIDAEPTIKPVLDLTEVASGLRQVDTALAIERGVRLSATVNQNGSSSQLDDFTNKFNLASETSNNKLISAIESIKGDIASLVDRVGQLQVVMDTGTVVGAIAPDMDKALGGLTNMTRRGVL